MYDARSHERKVSPNINKKIRQYLNEFNVNYRYISLENTSVTDEINSLEGDEHISPHRNWFRSTETIWFECCEERLRNAELYLIFHFLAHLVW